MKKMWKIFLTLSLCMGVFIGNASNVSAEEPHKHCVCADSACSETHNDEVEWIAWTATDSLPTSDGYYYLTQDVALDNTPVDIEYQNISLCLNGHAVSGSSWGELIYIVNTTLTITDCQSVAGNITNAIVEPIDIGGNSTLNLYNGELCSKRGVAVECKSSMNIYGGVIEGEAYGVRVLEGTAKMYGGTVRNTTNREYPVHVSSPANFYLYDGTIIGVSGGLASRGTCYLYGGSITGSWSAIYLSGGDCYLEGVELTAQDCVVLDGASLYMKNDTVFNGASSDIMIKTDDLIELTGPLTGTEACAVSLNGREGTFTKNWAANMPDADESQYFTSADSLYQVVETADGELALVSNVDIVEEMIENLPEAEDITLDDKEAVEKVKEAYDALTEDEKAQVDEALKAKLNAVVEALEKMKADAAKKEEEDLTKEQPVAPKTGDHNCVYLYLTLLLGSVMASTVILKRKRA